MVCSLMLTVFITSITNVCFSSKYCMKSVLMFYRQPNARRRGQPTLGSRYNDRWLHLREPAHCNLSSEQRNICIQWLGSCRRKQHQRLLPWTRQWCSCHLHFEQQHVPEPKHRVFQGWWLHFRALRGQPGHRHWLDSIPRSSGDYTTQSKVRTHRLTEF